MESTEKELTALDCKTQPLLEMYCPLVMDLGVQLFILNFLFHRAVGMHLAMPANLYIPT